ncbi:MAG: NusA-like transcription termination signal-binding factor [Nitrososphaerota archaeon]
MTEIKLTAEELRMMSLMQAISGVSPRDCVIDERWNRLIFVVNKEDMGRAIGKRGANVQQLAKLTGKEIEIVEFSPDPSVLLRNALGEKFVSEVRVTEDREGRRIAVVVTDSRNTKFVRGREGRNLHKAKLLGERYFQISDLQLVGRG